MTPRFTRSLLLATVALFGAIFAIAQDTHQLPANYLLLHAHPRFMVVPPHGYAPTGVNSHDIPGVDSLTNWVGSYRTFGYAPNGQQKYVWTYDMVGNPPKRGGTTTIGAPVIPIAMDLLNPDGSVFYHYGPRKIVSPSLQSPLFQNATFTSSPTPTQFNDAVQRATFWSKMAPDWHTMLNMSLKPTRTIAVPYRSYFYGLNADGTCCLFVLVDAGEFGNLMFPPDANDTSTPIGGAEHSGDITTRDLSTFLFRDTYLYFNGDPNQCCVLGYHTYDSKPGDANNGNREKRYVLNYSSWVTDGLFDIRWIDVTALSHELSEAINDPFVASDGNHNISPWWLAPNGVCSDAIEVGDVVENLADATFPVRMNGRTYHPQNVAILPWFAFESPSSAIDGAYSYPNETVVPALSPVELPGCQ